MVSKKLLFGLVLLVCFLFLNPGNTDRLNAQSPGTTSDQIARLSRVYSSPKTDNWVIRAFAALALKDIPDSRSAAAIAEILREEKPDPYLVSYALVCLKEFPDEVLRGALDPETIELLINTWFKKDNSFYRAQIPLILSKLADKKIKDFRAHWKNWWKKAKKSYQKKEPVTIKDEPKESVEKPKEDPSEDEDGETVGVFLRLKKLGEGGLDLVLVYDATGSMRPYIMQTQLEVRRMHRILKEITPDFRFGIVSYWDIAQVSLPLTNDGDQIEKKTKAMFASGGDDWAEGVDKGLELALFDEDMDWRPGASKVIIIIGDASPHVADLEKIYKLAKDAHELTLEKPEGKKGKQKRKRKRKTRIKKVTTGADLRAEPGTEPFTIHAMVVGTGLAPLGSATTENNDVLAIFSEVALNGGGIGLKLKNKEQVVQEIMLMAFGKEWEHEIKKFLTIFTEIISAEEKKKKKR